MESSEFYPILISRKVYSLDEIYLAVRYGFLRFIQYILQEVNLPETLLVHMMEQASGYGQVEIVKYLMTKIGNRESLGNVYKQAFKYGSLEIIKMISDSSIDPVIWAVYYENLPVLKYVLDTYGLTDGSDLSSVIYSVSQLETIRTLIPHFRKDQETLLILILGNRNTQIVEYVFQELGGSQKIKDEGLLTAVSLEYYSNVQFFLDSGAEITQTVLTTARKVGNPEILNLLL